MARRSTLHKAPTATSELQASVAPFTLRHSNREDRMSSSAHEIDENEQVSRLPPLKLPLDPIIEKLFEETRSRGGHILNLHKTNAHAPRLSRAKRPLTHAL